MHYRYLQLLLIPLLLLFSTACSRGNPKKAAPPKVTTAKIKQQDVPIYIDAIGQVIPPVTVNIRPQVAGMLMQVFVQQGAIVEKDQIIYEMDSRPYLALLGEAQSQLVHDEALLEYAKSAMDRYKKVVEEDFLSLLNWEQYVSNYEAAFAQVELDQAAIWAAQINVDYCTIKAPVAGKISYYNVDVGNILAVDDPNQLTVIRPFNPIDILFSLPQSQFELIRQVQGNSGEWRFVASLPEYPKNGYDGTTYFIDNQINQDTGTILLKGRLENDNRSLWPGEFIRVKVLHRLAPKALTVPPSSVLMGKDGAYIYLVNDEKKADPINVVVLTRTEEYIAIQSDKLHEGLTVIVEGQINVAPGLTVEVVPNNAKK
jgi:membrane fusion protein, multidrug efflux system